MSFKLKQKPSEINNDYIDHVSRRLNGFGGSMAIRMANDLDACLWFCTNMEELLKDIPSMYTAFKQDGFFVKNTVSIMTKAEADRPTQININKKLETFLKRFDLYDSVINNPDFKERVIDDILYGNDSKILIACFIYTKTKYP